MGTKMQCESYLPGYSSMRDLNEDLRSSWSAYYEDRALEKHLYNNFMAGPLHEYSDSGYDKEMLKRTMLEQEAVFRKQVCELHRLYRIQKDLMGDLRREELYKLPVQSGMSQSYLFSSAMASETEKKWQMPYLTDSRAGFNMTTVTEEEDIKLSLDLLKEKRIWFSQFPQNRASLEDGEFSGSKLKGLPREMIDLQLPADVYIDIEDSGRIEKEEIVNPFFKIGDNSSTVCNIEDENDVKLTLGPGDDCSGAGGLSDSIRPNGQSIQSLNFLIESKRGLSCEGDSGSVSNHSHYANIVCGNLGCHQLPTKSNRSFLSRDLFTDKHTDEGPCSKSFNADREESVPGWPPFSYIDAGSSRNRANSFTLGLINNDKCPLLSESSELKVKRENNFRLHEHSQTQTWFEEKPTQTWFEEKPTLGAGPYQKGSLYANSKDSASVLTDSQVPGPLSVIPVSEGMNCASPVVQAKRKPRRDITHVPIAVQALPCFPASEMMKYQKRKHTEFTQNSTAICSSLQPDRDLKSQLGGEIELSPSEYGFHHDLSSDSSSSPQFKHNSDSPVHEKSKACASQKFPNLQTNLSFSRSLSNDAREDGKLEESSSGVSGLKVKPSCTNSRAAFSLSKSLNQSPESFPSSLKVKEKRKLRQRTSQSVSTKKNLGYVVINELQENAIRTEVSGGVTVTGKGIGENSIDLNTTSTEDVVPNSIEKSVHDIDLEVLIPFSETPANLAAENLVVMSLGLTQQLAPASCDPLHWFANVVSSTEAKAGDDDYDDGDDKMVDVFESSTLKLEEMKPEEYLPPPQEQEKQHNENDLGVASLILTKTRRGQLRKRRQKKDFQKDILPGLKTLSRHEVTEDLQAFDCLMRAMVEPWECNLKRRSTGRRGPRGQGRGRRRPQILDVAITDKVDIGERSLIGWGRTTRRGRRPRVKPGNASLIVT
ncbi:uncharacterized protein LOC109819947 isoform X1 [Asparagus officinalis]|uniref:uncharacterized protein LOC109819947 isoform X1 n=1 Tax=Asparagus officinalis TaxID=4686 RepID=UPI00098E1F16|nr:uncharacterized protein LOC109819947 isoform X1 [Asparagus officinalis]XP_020241543.1 uncharacterized protein LOC109819947 isoform X1 [Asparagus officinalis]